MVWNFLNMREDKKIKPIEWDFRNYAIQENKKQGSEIIKSQDKNQHTKMDNTNKIVSFKVVRNHQTRFMGNR